jgi:hypothetical protein
MEQRYWRKLLEIKSQLPEQHFERVSKYQSRSTYARQLRSTKIDGLSHATAEGYFVMLKLSLVYSAIELIHPGVISNLAVTDKNFAAALSAGKFAKLLEALSRPNSKFGSTSKVDLEWAAAANERTDLLPLITHCRHLMFHGAFSPNETGLTLLSRQTLLLGLGLAALEQADLALEARVTKLYAKRVVLGMPGARGNNR